MNTKTFKRYEKKYFINKNQFNELYSLINENIIPDKFDKYTIRNIYYDTKNYEIIRNSIEKPLYKEKLRLRSYGNDNDNLFFELKKKYKKEVFKRRVIISNKEFNDYSKNINSKKSNNQILNEIDYFISLYRPEPKIFIAYERLAFCGKDDNNLRVTFDYNLRYRTNDLSLSFGDYGNNIIDNDKYILEIKVRGSIPLWLSNSLNHLNIYPQSFSKYGHCYTQYINTNIERSLS